MKKEDRRVKKTEKALAEALSKLLVDKKNSKHHHP